jgi:hypothetical protein
MRYWKPQEAMKRPLLSPSEAAPACRSAQAETFGGYQLVDYGAAKELIAATISQPGQAVFKSIRPEGIE